jgi:hypothetical protein
LPNSWFVFTSKLTFSIWGFCCRTVALWFYILVFDNNDTDPIMQINCNFGTGFSAHVKDDFVHFQAFFNQIFYSLILKIFYYQPVYMLSTSIHLYKPVNLLGPKSKVNMTFGWQQIQNKGLYWSVKKIFQS